MLDYKISIIVPIYNSEKFLDKCINSIINQTYNNIEIILVNDGSTDNSLNICKKFSKLDNRICLINKENGGVSSARNKGLELVSGDYVGFVDSDDYVSLDMYEKLLRAILKSNADIAECGYYTVNPIYEITDIVSLNNDEVHGNYACSYNYLVKSNTTNFNVNKLYKSSIFKKLRYPNLKYSEDYVVNVKAHSYCEKKITISDCCYYYVDNIDSACNQDFNQSRLDIIYAGKEVLMFNENRFTELNKYIYIYLLNNIRKLYEQLEESGETNKEYYIQLLSDEYKKCYSKVSHELYKAVKRKKTYFS